MYLPLATYSELLSFFLTRLRREREELSKKTVKEYYILFLLLII